MQDIHHSAFYRSFAFLSYVPPKHRLYQATVWSDINKSICQYLDGILYAGGTPNPIFGTDSSLQGAQLDSSDTQSAAVRAALYDSQTASSGNLSPQIGRSMMRSSDGAVSLICGVVKHTYHFQDTVSRILQETGLNGILSIAL